MMALATARHARAHQHTLALWAQQAVARAPGIVEAARATLRGLSPDGARFTEGGKTEYIGREELARVLGLFELAAANNVPAHIRIRELMSVEPASGKLPEGATRFYFIAQLLGLDEYARAIRVLAASGAFLTTEEG